MNDYLVSLLRTWIPVGVGAALAWLGTYGVEISTGEQAGLVAALTAVCTGGYYALVRAGEHRWPWLGFLLGTRKPPAYPTRDLDSDLDE